MTPTAGSNATAMAVRKTLIVNAPRERAFEVFTSGFGTWWPLKTHHIGAQAAATAILEPRAGGRWFERGVDGEECDWGRVLIWDPPGRLVLGWELNSDWKHDASLQTEIEVRFIAEGAERTRVEFEHRNLDRFGDKAAKMREALGSPEGWGVILERYAEYASTGTLPPEADSPQPC